MFVARAAASRALPLAAFSEARNEAIRDSSSTKSARSEARADGSRPAARMALDMRRHSVLSDGEKLTGIFMFFHPLRIFPNERGNFSPWYPIALGASQLRYFSGNRQSGPLRPACGRTTSRTEVPSCRSVPPTPARALHELSLSP